MRKTVDIPDSLYRQLKARAAREGRTVEDLLLQRVEGDLRAKPKKNGKRVKLPLVRSKHPGTVHLDNAKIYELIPFP